MATKPRKGTLKDLIAQNRKKVDKEWDKQHANDPETFHYGNAVVHKPGKLIQAAVANHKAAVKEAESIVAHMTMIAEQQSITPAVLAESVTNLLANIAVAAQEGKPIKLMHLNSVAAFMAGVEAMANALPVSQDEEKKQNTLRVLAVAGIGTDGHVNMETVPIVNLGARKEELKSKYVKLIHDYMLSVQNGNPEGTALMAATRQLQLAVDRAMRSAAAPRSMARTGAEHP